MCGITGIFAYRPAAPKPEAAELRRMRDYMAARGPDGAGEWLSDEGRVALGHRRLSIIDLEDRAAQPMTSVDGRLAITFNGEIYNYRALRASLEARGYVFRTESDTEVLLHLYAAKGRDMVRELRGMFAFAIYDVARGGLFLARDPYGIKPLYYSDDGYTFRFASQVRALLASDKVSRDADPAGWLGFYYFGSVPEPHTTYRQIHALRAGSTLWIGDEVGKVETYVDLATILVEAEMEPGPTSSHEAASIIRSALLDSVRHHMVSDVPVGLFLSAGIDSGSLLGLMRDVHQADIEAVTLAYSEYRDTDADEAPLAAKTANTYGCRHTVRTVTEAEFREDLPQILSAMDQPSIDGINTWFVSKAARELGLKAAISGLGGDELFGGYPSFRDLPRVVGALGRVPGLSRLGEAGRHLMRPFMWRANPKFAGLLKYGTSYPGAYYLLRGLFMPWELRSVVHDQDFLREGVSRLEPLAHISEALRPEPRDSFSKVACLEASLYMRNQLLRDTDWASMAHSLEVRVPFVDLTLIKTILPAVLRLPRGTGKQILASVPSRPLPAEVVWRMKTGFGTPVNLWLQRDSRMQDWRRVRILSNPRCAWARRWAYQLATVGRTIPSVSFAPRAERLASTQSIIIFRIGSIGDTVCAIPCFQRIAEKFADYNRILVTDIPSKGKGAPVESIIGNSGLIHDVLYFPANTRTIGDLLALRRQIRKTKASILIYVADRTLLSTLRDILFFYMCGIRKVIGAPLTKSLRVPRIDTATGEQERETERLTRCLAPLGEFDLNNRALWDLHLQPNELQEANRVLAPLEGRPFIAVNLGGKVAVKDWGEANWIELLQSLAAKHSDVALVFFGSPDEWNRCERMVSLWSGPAINLCGALTPRQSAAALKRAVLFVGHDSGPMHLAAAVGVTCVSMLGNYNRPKRWHPYGPQHRIIHNMSGVEAVSPSEVRAEIERLLFVSKSSARQPEMALT